MRKHLQWLLLLLLVTGLFSSTETAHAQPSTKSISIPEALKKISKVYGTEFFYDKDLVKGKATTYNLDNIKGKPLEEVLKAVLYPNGFLFVYIKRNYYTIIPKDRVGETTTDQAPTTNTSTGMGSGADRVITGTVVDEANNPLAGATVSTPDKRGVTIVNEAGSFSMTVPRQTNQLTVTSVGYNPLTINLTSAGSYSIVLKSTSALLQNVEVIATGYQTISKERATGSYGIIGKDQLEKPTSNIATRLIGTTAGVQASLDVDGNPTFQIRGLTSLYANSQPLIVVDGFPIQGDFNSVNPNDVESVTILKDAAAASIWGARSANGVIVIVTKKAKRGTPLKVEFNVFTRIGKKIDLDYVNPLAPSDQTVEYEKMSFNKWSAQLNSGSFQTNYNKQWSLATVALSEHDLGFITAAQRDAILAQLKTQDNRGQISDHLLANPSTQQYNLTLSGSSGKMQNTLSLMFEDNQSNFKETDSKRYMVNFRNNVEVFKWLDFNFSGFFVSTKQNNNGVGLGDIQNISPYEMLVNPDGSLANQSRFYWPIMERFVPMRLFPYADWTYNPIQEIKNRRLESEQLNTRIQAGLTFKILKGLTFDTKGQFELFNINNRNYYNENTFQVRSIINQATTWNQTTNAMTLNLPKGGMLMQDRSKVQSYNLRNQLNFNRVFSTDHEVSFLAGAEVNNMVSETFGHPTTYGYNDQTLSVGTFPRGPGGTFFPIQNWLGANQTFAYNNSFSYRTERYFSAFGNMAYTFKQKYTISGSYRTDASNLITDDPKYRYAPFWSVGFGWQLYRENFMRDISWLDRLSLRATYGYNGNVDKSTSFRPLIATGGAPNVYTQDLTATVSSFGNPTLRWEKTGTWNIGADYSLFNGKLYGKFDLYNKYGRDLIALLSIPAVNGTTSQRLNNAEMSNRGVELELGTQLDINKNISWRGGVNFSYNKNEIEKLFIANYPASTLYSGGTGAYVVGENANSIWRFKYAGVVNQQPQVVGAKGATYDFGAFTPGDGREYMVNPGTTVAPYTLGFMNAFQVYDFNLSFIVTGKFGHVFQRTGFNYPPTWTTRVLPNKKLSEVINGDPSRIVPLPYNANEPRYYFWDRFHQYLDYLIEDASHVRMQEVNLTYGLPKSLSSRFHISRLQVYAQANDLFTIYANDAGEDPEYRLGTMNPRPKLTVGIKCEF